MNKVIFSMSVFTLFMGFTACNNPSSVKNNEHSGMGHDAKVSDTRNETGMSMAMNKMMTDMHQMQMTGNVDNDFALMMKGHHQGAVDMAQVELQSGKDETLKQMAQKIMNDQKSEIGELQTFLDNHQDPAKNYDPAKKDEGFAMVMDKSMMNDENARNEC